MTEVIDRRSAWTRYWHSGALHSLTGTLPDDYSGNTGEFWRGVLSSLKPGKRMLDLGTGNGALPALACRLLAGRLPHIDAVDLAELAPRWLADAPQECRNAVRFHCGCDMERLPFDDARFDLVVSQYAFEYSTLERSVPELARVLRPGGRVALVMHADHSRLAHVARAEVAHAAWLVARGGFLEAASGLYPFVARAATAEGRAMLKQDSVANAARARYNEAVSELTRRADSSDVPDLLLHTLQAVTRLAGAAAATGAAHIALQSHGEYVMQLREAALRYEELVEHALDPDGLEALIKLLSDAGLEDHRVGELHHERGAVLGWTLTARKPA